MKTKGLSAIKSAIDQLLARGPLYGTAYTARRTLLCCGACAGIAFLPVFAAPARASYAYEMKFQESLQAFKRGDYKSAMLGFMDIVIEDPKNDLAGKYLRESGLRVLELENGKIQRRREELLRGAKKMKKRLDSLEKVKEEKILEWNKAFLRVKKLAEDPDSLRKVFPAYADFVKKTPIYAERQAELYEKERIIREILVKTVKNSAPDLVISGTGIADSDLAVMFSSRFVFKGVMAESVLAELSRIKDMRGRISALFEYETRALDLYARGRVEEADALFRRVLKVDTGNVEAAFYSNIASERIIASSFPATPLPAVRAAAASVCVNDLCPRTDTADARTGAVMVQRPPPGAGGKSVHQTPAAPQTIASAKPAGLPEKPLVERDDGVQTVREQRQPDSVGGAFGHPVAATAVQGKASAALPRGAVASRPAGLPEKTVVESYVSVEDVAEVVPEAASQPASDARPDAATEQRPRASVSPAKRAVAQEAAQPRVSVDAMTEAYGYQMSASMSEVPAESEQVGSAVSADKLYEQGVREFSVGNYGAAAIIWKECLRIDPGHKKAKLGLKRLESVVLDQ